MMTKRFFISSSRAPSHTVFRMMGLAIAAAFTVGPAMAQDGAGAGQPAAAAAAAANTDAANPLTVPPSARSPIVNEPVASGRQTRAWLEMQAGRQQASKTRQTVSGPVMSKIHERYVNSFKTPVHESVRDTTPVSNGAK